MEEEVEESEANWFDGAIVEELIRELLDDAPPFIISPKPPESKSSEDDDNDHPHKTIINKLISTVYSGPTISDIESALPMSFRSSSSSNNSHASMILWPEKGMEKMENKYTVRVKRSSQSGLADDGYKWRKYGQKSIKNSTNPRSYYRCTNPRCSAKKQVERSMEDPDALIVTYEGVHLHYSSFSQFLQPRSHDHYSGTGPHAAKKPKLQFKNQQQACTSKEKLISTKYVEQRQEGLLDDIVPLLVRKPCNSATLSNHPSQHSQASSPSNPSFLSWSPVSSYLDVDILNSYHILSE